MKRFVIIAMLLGAAQLGLAQSDSAKPALPDTATVQACGQTCGASAAKQPRWSIGVRAYSLTSLPGNFVLEHSCGAGRIELDVRGSGSYHPDDYDGSGSESVNAVILWKRHYPVWQRTGWFWGAGPDVSYSGYYHRNTAADASSDFLENDVSIGLSSRAGCYLDGRLANRKVRLELGVTPVTVSYRYDWRRYRERSWQWDQAAQQYQDVTTVRTYLNRDLYASWTLNSSVSLSLLLMF